MLIPLLTAALALQDAPVQMPADPPRPTIDQLSIEQSAAARCAIAFATISRWQKTGDPRGAGYAEMEKSGGREFFVQVMAKLMAEVGFSREDVIAIASRGVEEFDTPEGAKTVAAMMPACQAMKSAAGL